MLHFIEEELPLGTDYFGDIHQVPGLLRVATKCHHILDAPLVPRGTYIVVEPDDANTWARGGGEPFPPSTTELPFSWKSYGAAWERWCYVTTGTVCLALGLADLFRAEVGGRRWSAILAAMLWGTIATGLPAGWKIARRLTLGICLGIAACFFGPFSVEAWAVGPGVFCILLAEWDEHQSRATRAMALELAGRARLPRRRVEAYLDRLNIS
ncbi:MAG: hypothetical protein KF773_35625 [Deltaproteobacteria bacterium]|nr:hypothetical protein [Deltaproteobacteria bacterium]